MDNHCSDTIANPTYPCLCHFLALSLPILLTLVCTPFLMNKHSANPTLIFLNFCSCLFVSIFYNFYNL